MMWFSMKPDSEALNNEKILERNNRIGESMLRVSLYVRLKNHAMVRINFQSGPVSGNCCRPCVRSFSIASSWSNTTWYRARLKIYILIEL